MRALYFDVLEQPGPHAIGRARLDRIERLLPEHPIDSILTVLDDVGEKIGELTVSLSIEELLNGSVKDGNHCDHSVPVAVIGTGSQQVGPIDQNPDYVAQLPTVHSRQLDNIAVSRTRPNPSESQLSDPEGTNLRENCHYCSKSRLDEDIDPFYVKGAPCAPNAFGEHALDLRSSVSSEVSNDDKLEKRCPAVPESANDHCSAFENARHVNVAQGKDAGDYPASEEQTRCPNEAPVHSSGVRSSKEDGTSRVNASSNLPVLLRSPSSSELHCSTTKGCDIAFAENYLGDSDRGVAHSPTEAFFPTLPNHHSDASKRLTDLELNLIEEQPLSSPTWNKYGNSPFGELLADGQLVEELFSDPTSTKLLPFKVIPHGRTPGTTDNSLHFPQHSTLGVSQKRKMHELQAIRIHIQCVHLTREFSRVLSTSVPSEDRLLRPKIVNMKADGIPTALREPGRSSEHPHPPKSLPASSVTTSRILRSRSASPKGNRELRHLTLEISVPMHSLKDSHLVYMTNTCRLSMENSTRHPHATGFAQSPDASTVRLVPESLDQSTSLVNLTGLPSPTEEHIRFRLFSDANSSFTQPVSEFMCSGDLPIEDLKAAITEKVLAPNDPTARLSLPVYSHLLMRSSMRSSREKLYQTNPHGRIELILEPHWSVTPRHESDATPLQMHQSVRFKEPIKPDNFPSTLKQTQSIPLDTLLSVSHGRGLRLSERDQSGGVSIQPAEHTYLTVRLPWCQAESDERTASSAKRTTCRFKSVVCWTGGQRPTYKFALKTSCNLDEKLLLRLSRSVAVIEVWATFISGSPDRLIGLSKLPLDALANTFARLDPQAQSVTLYSEAVLKAILSYAHPAIAINQWIPVIDPFTGSECGQIRVRLAAGTPDQINTLQMTDSQGRPVIDPDGRGWEALDIIRWPKFCPSPEEESAGDFAEHCLTVTIESLQEFDPHSALRSDAELGGSVPWGDCDCFVQYYFPSGTRPDALARHRTPVQLLVAPTLETITGELKPTTHLVSCKFRTASKPSNEDLGNIAPLEPYWSQQHRVCLCVRRRRIERGTEGLGDCRRSLQHGLDSGESLKNIHPGAGYKLFASSRIPLGGLLFSNRGCIPKRMYPLCRFLKQSTSGVPCGRFGGGVELSAQFVDGLRGRYRLLEYAVRHHTEETELMHCIRRWAIPLPLLSSSNGDDESTIELDEEPCLWHNGIDEYGHGYKHITIHLDAAKLPSAETLLAERSSIVESPAPDLNLFAGYAFVRFQFYRHGTQTTRMVPLPCGLGRCVSGIVEFSDQKQYTLHVSSDCRSYLTEAELEFQVWALWTHRMGQPTSSHNEESDIAVGVEGLMQERPHLDIDPPSPCFIGSTRITLSRLLFHSSRHIAPNTNESVVEVDGAIASGYVSVSGDPSGLKWWPMGSHLHPPRCAQPLPVFPIYRTNSSFLHDSWIAIRISMHGSRSQLNIRSISESRAPIDPNADGQLGWNLGACPAVPRLAYPQTRMSVGGQEIGDESIETTFPAEIIVELAYHLKPSCSTSLSGATKENTNCLSPSDFVFVTFPVDGDKTGTLSSYDGLWTRVANARKKPISGRIAVTTKVPMGTSVCWNYRRFARLPTWLVEPRTRRALPFHVWLERHADTDLVSNCDPSSMGCKPELIGIASVDLTSLSGLFSSVGPGGYAPNGTVSGGLDQVYGWYNVVNSCGTHCGQILLGVRPLIPGLKSATSLSRFGSTELLDLDRQPFQSDVPIDGRFTCSSPLSRMRRILSSGPSTNMPGESTHSVPDLNAAGLITQDATTSGFGTDLEISSLFHNLRTQLNELDNINSKFRQRLTQGTNLYCPVTAAGQDSTFAKAQVPLGSSSPPGQQASAGDNSKILLVDCQTSDELGQPARLISKPGKGCKASGPLPSGHETSVGCVASDNIAANEVMVPLQKSNSACPLQLELAEEGTLDQVISPEVGERCPTITSVDCSDHLPCLDLSVCSDAGTHSINLDESQHSLPFEENDRLSQQTSRLLASPCSPRPERGDSELQFEFSPVEERDQHSSSEICDVSPLLVRSEMEPEDAVTMRCELSAELSSRSSKETLRENAVGEVLDGEQDAAQNEDITWSFPGNPTRVLEKPAGGVELDEPLDRSSPTSRSASHSQLLMPKSPPINEKATEPAAQVDNSSFALVPDFFPPPSAFSKTVFGSETKSDASDSLTARLMQLRSGLRETMESMAPQTSSTLSSHKDQFEVLRHRVDARIAGVLDRMDKGANLSSGAKPNDPLLSVLNGLRPRSLQVAERAFSWEEPK
ncbi:unnamed protein product [Dicrocoelium dendriticum]|nr:unnamed protein product [Dicrocoelium dendriticum]